MADARREWVQPASCSRKMAMIFLKSRVFGKFPCIGRSRGEIASIPVPGNAPWFGGKPLVRNGDNPTGTQRTDDAEPDERIGLIWQQLNERCTCPSSRLFGQVESATLEISED
jgi:hypothetical protein